MKTVTDILRAYASGEIEVEEANAQLAAMGAGFHLEPGKKPGWTEEEMEEGFIPSDNHATALPQRPDMRRRIELAGKTVRQEVATGAFDVTYDKDGYAVSAIRV